MVGAAPPALKKLKTTPRVRPSVTLACNPSSSGSTGLTRYLGETTLSFDEDEAAGDVGGVASFPTTQSGMVQTEALEDDRGSGSLAASTQIMANNLFESKSAEEEGGVKCASITQSKAGWTEAEDQMVLLAVRTYGTQWNAVSSQLAGRTADAVRPPYLAHSFGREQACMLLAQTIHSDAPWPTLRAGAKPVASASEARSFRAVGRLGPLSPAAGCRCSGGRCAV